MFGSLTFVAALALTSVLGAPQYGNSPASTSSQPSPTTSSSSASSVPTIVVAENGLSFTPNSVTVAAGSQVVFMWSSTLSIGHSVTQSFPDAPCSPFSTLSGGPKGFDSGVIDIKSAAWVFTVKNASVPIFFQCIVPGHCNGANMFGVINPSATGTGSLSSASAGVAATPSTGDMAYASIAAAAISASGTPAVGNAPSSGSNAPTGSSPTIASTGTGSPSSANSYVRAGLALSVVTTAAMIAGVFMLAL